MIILNRCKDSSETIHHVLHKKSMSPILYTKEISNVSKYCETILHSLQQLINGVGHSGCLHEIALHFQMYLLRMESNPEYISPRHLFFQPVKAIFKLISEQRVKNWRFWFGKRGVCYYKRR